MLPGDVIWYHQRTYNSKKYISNLSEENLSRKSLAHILYCHSLSQMNPIEVGATDQFNGQKLSISALHSNWKNMKKTNCGRHSQTLPPKINYKCICRQCAASIYRNVCLMFSADFFLTDINPSNFFENLFFLA